MAEIPDCGGEPSVVQITGIPPLAWKNLELCFDSGEVWVGCGVGGVGRVISTFHPPILLLFKRKFHAHLHCTSTHVVSFWLCLRVVAGTPSTEMLRTVRVAVVCQGCQGNRPSDL